MDVTPRYPISRFARRAPLLAALLMAAICGCAQQAHWYPDYPQGERAAQAQNRPMLLFFWDWLSRDQARVDVQLFPNPRVAAALRRTVNVRLEAGWFRDLARQYDVRQTPTFILTDSSGVERSRLVGVPTPERFVTWLEDALRQAPATQPAAALTTPAATAPADMPAAAPPASEPTP